MRNLSNSTAVNRELMSMSVEATKQPKSTRKIEKGTLLFLGYILAIGAVIATLYSLGLIID